MKSNFNKIFDAILQNHKNKAIKDRLESPQFIISQEILSQRIKQGLTKQQAAKKSGLSLSDYMSFENATNTSATKNDYLNILKLVKSYNQEFKGFFTVDKGNILYLRSNHSLTTKVNTHSTLIASFQGMTLRSASKKGGLILDENDLSRLSNQTNFLQIATFS